MNRHERRASAKKEARGQATRKAQRLRELERFAKLNPAEAEEAREYEFVRKPAIVQASRALRGMTPEQKRKVLEVVVAACGGTVEWRE